MAKKKQSKTEAIRAALKQSDSPSEIAALLKKQGFKVTPQYVSTIKANDKKRAAAGTPKRKPGRPAKQAPTANVDTNLQTTAELLSDAVGFVVKCGSAKQARQLIDVADKLVASMH